MSSVSSLSEAPSAAEVVLERLQGVAHRHTQHASPTTNQGPKPIAADRLRDTKLNIYFKIDPSISRLKKAMREEDVPPLIELLSIRARDEEATTYDSEATLSHSAEINEGALLSWILSTSPFTQAVERALGRPPVERFRSQWERGHGLEGGGRIGKVICHPELQPRQLTGGEWKSSRVMHDDMQELQDRLSAILDPATSAAQQDTDEPVPVIALRDPLTVYLADGRVEFYSLPPGFPTASIDTIRDLCTLIVDSWAYGVERPESLLPIVTHNGAWGMRTVPWPTKQDDPNESFSVSALLSVGQPSMALWMAASTLEQLRAYGEDNSTGSSKTDTSDEAMEVEAHDEWGAPVADVASSPDETAGL